MCFAAAPIVSPSRPACGFFLFPPISVLLRCKSEGEGKKEVGKKKEGRTAAWMLNLGVIFRAVRLWISVLTVSENELFRFRLAASASPLPALTLSLSLTLSLFVHSLSFFPPPRLCLPPSFHSRCPTLAPFHPSFLPDSALTPPPSLRATFFPALAEPFVLPSS